MSMFRNMVADSVTLKNIVEADEPEALVEPEVNSSEDGDVDPDAEMTGDEESADDEESTDDEDKDSDEDKGAEEEVMLAIKVSTDKLDDLVVDKKVLDTEYEELTDLINSLLNKASDLLGVVIPEDEDEVEEPAEAPDEDSEEEESDPNEVSADDIEFD